jgi:hypothetical protein
MRRSRDELAEAIEEMLRLRAQNKTYRQIADIMGYKSPGTVSDLLRRRGHFSVVLNQLEINYLLNALRSRPANTLVSGIVKKLTKLTEESHEKSS